MKCLPAGVPEGTDQSVRSIETWVGWPMMYQPFGVVARGQGRYSEVQGPGSERLPPGWVPLGLGFGIFGLSFFLEPNFTGPLALVLGSFRGYGWRFVASAPVVGRAVLWFRLIGLIFRGRGRRVSLSFPLG